MLKVSTIPIFLSIILFGHYIFVCWFRFKFVHHGVKYSRFKHSYVFALFGFIVFEFSMLNFQKTYFLIIFRATFLFNVFFFSHH